jgi:hemerythrin-like metal-binding protein
MPWNPKLSVNVQVIDDDHKQLLALINGLDDAIHSQHGSDVLGSLLDNLVAYTQYHFAHEEDLFIRTGYKDAARHKAQHVFLTEQLLELQQRHHSGQPVLTLDVMVFLKDWLYGHILGSDTRLGPHLNANGIR